MTDMKWTPGPWSIDSYPGRVSVAGRSGFSGNYRVADAYYSEALANCPRADERKANANLIAAAPDLYETLENLLLVAPIDGCEQERLAAFCALAKARGEA